MKIRDARWIVGALILIGCSAPRERREDLPALRSLWDFNHPAETRQRFQDLLGDLDPADHGPFCLEIQTQIARTHGLEREFEKAHGILDEVEGALEDAPPVVQVRYLLERGRVFNSSGKPDEARPLFLEAWDRARDGDEHGLAVDAAHMVAIVEKGEASLKWNQQAIDYAEATGDPRARAWLGSLYNNTGWSYHEMGEYEKAMDLWRRGLAWHRETAPGSDRERIARYTVGRGLRSLGRHEEALAIQEEILPLEQDGYVLEEIAECLQALGREEEAREHFRMALEILGQDHWLVQNEPERLERMKRLSGGE